MAKEGQHSECPPFFNASKVDNQLHLHLKGRQASERVCTSHLLTRLEPRYLLCLWGPAGKWSYSILTAHPPFKLEQCQVSALLLWVAGKAASLPSWKPGARFHMWVGRQASIAAPAAPSSGWKPGAIFTLGGRQAEPLQPSTHPPFKCKQSQLRWCGLTDSWRNSSCLPLTFEGGRFVLGIKQVEKLLSQQPHLASFIWF